ncbi:MAG TPA: diguanylate cyclase [Solimonas sp.]|nr:diguanylate cyclase [Solimonas sp.]
MRALFPGSIVARTTVAIIALALLVGLVFGSAAAVLIQRGEKERLGARLGELLSTVETTARIACFVQDTALAREIGTGLMNNHVVAGVRIVSDKAPLYEQRRSEAPKAADETIAISRKLTSPFNERETVGEIWLYASAAEIQAQAWTYTRFILLVLALEVALVAAAVAWVVFNLITRPIKGISDELHRMETRTGLRLHVPQGNQQDEIGRLVGDVNALIAELTGLIDTERRLRIEREQSERRLALIFEKVDAGIFEVDATGRLRSWNPAFARTLGTPAQPPDLHALLPQQEEPLNELIRQSLDSGELREADLQLKDAAGGPDKWIEISLTPVDQDMLQGVINDITGRKRTEMAAQHLATRDTLTGLLNRRGFDQALSAARARRLRDPGLEIALLLIDLDFFKQVNDRHGHEAGDTVLRRVAAVLEQAVRRTDHVGRFGGDEFAIVLIGVDEPARAGQIAEAIIAALREPIPIGEDLQAQIGASIGITFAGGDSDSSAAMLRRADEAMYAAKQAGRSQARLAPAPEPG